MMDQRYLNYENAPIVSPLRKPLGIEMYNETHFHPKPPNTTSTTADLPSNAIDEIAFKVHDESATSAASPNVTSIPDNISHEPTWQTWQMPVEQQLLEPSYVSIIDLHNTVSKLQTNYSLFSIHQLARCDLDGILYRLI